MQTPFTRIEGGSTQLPQPPAAAVPLTTYLRENDLRGEAEGELAVMREQKKDLLWLISTIAEHSTCALSRAKCRVAVEAYKPGTYPRADSELAAVLDSLGLDAMPRQNMDRARSAIEEARAA